MKYDKIIVDADFCIKLGGREKYRYLEKLLIALSHKVYIHKIVYDEILIPASVKNQIDCLIRMGIMEIVDDSNLHDTDAVVYKGVYSKLSAIMRNPKKPNKNMGETASLSIAKTISIPYFCTDEKDLQSIIDKNLNTGINDITCIRIQDIIYKIKAGEIEDFNRKDAKMLWKICGKETLVFDKTVWPIT